MEIEVEVRGAALCWQGTRLSPDRALRWLRWRQPSRVRVIDGQRVRCFSRQEFEALLRRAEGQWAPAELEAQEKAKAPQKAQEKPLEGCYAFLGVSPETSWGALKTAYHRLAFRAHPDRGGDVALMQAINAAYRVICKSRNSA